MDHPSLVQKKENKYDAGGSNREQRLRKTPEEIETSSQ
jgi:hypothetical protein